MKQITLNDGKIAFVDDVNYDYLSQFCWAHKDGYAVRRKKLESGRRISISMHREICNSPRGFDVDHIDGQKLNNQKSNLRVATKQQNQFNRGANKGSASKHKGVSWYSKHKLWRASIRINKKTQHLGLFNTEEEAAAAYNAVATGLHGEYARFNNVPAMDDWQTRRVFKPQGTSKFRGVSLHKLPNRWKASIRHADKIIYIGLYDSEIEAAKAYNRVAIELRGIKAVLNRFECEEAEVSAN